jgi:HAD superfamily hydrolase (TIGR01549 family)
MIKALIFDYNQVLVNDLQAHIQAYQNTFNKYGLSLKAEELKQIMHKSHEEKLSYLKEKYGIKADLEKLFHDKEGEFLRIAKTRELLFPGTEQHLKELSRRYILAIFSGTTRKQIALSRGVLQLFKAIVTEKDYEKKKPDPQGLLKCCEKLHLQPKECAYVGDAAHDMEAAKKAGCKAIGTTTGNFSLEELRKADADVVINSLKELLEIDL